MIYNKEISSISVYQRTEKITTPKYFKIENIIRVTYAETEADLTKGENIAIREYPEGTNILNLPDHKGAKLVV